MKFKQIPSSYYITILDRLTRFEPAYKRYNRVFDDIINKFCINIKACKLSTEEKIAIVCDFFSDCIPYSNDFYLNDVLIKLEELYFIFNEESYQYLSARINILSILNKIDENQSLPKNVAWLKEISNNRTDIFKLRQCKALTYPIDKLILCEGQTEYILLKTIFNLFNIDFEKLGYLIIPAGGKNQVARKYYEMIEYTKLPFFVLLDKDAATIKELIDTKLRTQDRLYLINSGEFEDLIPKIIIQKAINNAHFNEYSCVFSDFDDKNTMSNNIENIYRKYGFGEFKKAKFALDLKEYIRNYCKKDDFINSEIIEIINSLQ